MGKETKKPCTTWIAVLNSDRGPQTTELCSEWQAVSSCFVHDHNLARNPETYFSLNL